MTNKFFYELNTLSILTNIPHPSQDKAFVLFLQVNQLCFIIEELKKETGDMNE